MASGIQFPSRGSKLTEEQWEVVRQLEAEGVPRSQIARRIEAKFGVSITSSRLSKILGPKTDRPTPKSRPVQIILSDDELEELRRIAAELGYTGYIGKTAGVGSLSALLRAIARGDVKVERIG